MGRSIVNFIHENPRLELSGALEMSGHPMVGSDAGEVAGLGKLGVKITDNPKRAFRNSDVIIDFSNHEATIGYLEEAASPDNAFVIGTTGFSHHQRDRIKELSEQTRVVMAPNMSVGVNLLLKLVQDTAFLLGGDYDIEIVESHHRHKKDAPSGTALRIAEVAAYALGRNLEKVAVYERKGIVGERKPEEIGIQCIRGGDIVGDHTVIFAGPGERIELTHRAHSRDTFAAGAIKAALWVVEKPNGLYDMQDVLGLKEPEKAADTPKT
jgi:4-hydroxy-tetrahydrodipicolinate reductase